MQEADLRELLENHGLPDQWWLSVNGDVQPEYATLDTALAHKQGNPDSKVQISNSAQQDQTPIPWHKVELPGEGAQPIPPTAVPPQAAPATPPVAAQAVAAQPVTTHATAPVQAAAPSQTMNPQMQPQNPYGAMPVTQSPQMKTVLLGLMLILGSWGMKQLLASFSLYGLGGALSTPVVEASKGAEIAKKTVSHRLDIYREQQEKKPDSKLIKEAQEEISDVTEEVSEKYAEKSISSQADSASGLSLATNTARWFLRTKILLDIVKMAGIFLIVLGSFRVLNDPMASPHNRWFAIVISSIILFSVLAAGVASLLA